MRKRKIFALFLAVILCFGAFGCSSTPETVQVEDGQKVVQDDPGYHIRDKKLMYEQHDPLEVVTMYLTVSTGNSADGTNHTWEEVNTYSVYDYEAMGVDRYKVDGLLQVGDESGVLPGELGYGQESPNCTIQIRGQTSSRSPQKNYKISIKDNKGQWRGQSTIALNKHQTEGIRFRNKLAYDLIAGVDQIMGLRTTFVHLYVKDTTAGGDGVFRDYGLYTQVEQLNKTALKAHGLDRNGHLYKINYFEFYRYEDTVMLKDDPGYDVKKFEELLEIKGSDDHTKLINMLEKVNDYSIPIEDILAENFDSENIVYWLAFNILMGNVDTQSRNVYIYSPLNSDRWYFIPWDNDASLRKEEHKILGRSDYSEWETGVSNYWGNVFFQRCLKSESFRAELTAAIEYLKKYLSPEKIDSLASSYASVVKPFVYRYPDSTYAPLTSSQYDTVIGGLKNEIDLNYGLYYESYNKPMPFFIGVPEKKDGMISILWDAAYDFDDEKITYSFELATDSNFSNIIYKNDTLGLPTTQFDMLPQGQYFIRVKATNESGYTQTAFDYYVNETGKIYGTKCFYVNGEGNIVEDVYVEN